ncbi:MAG: DegV family protein [Firmicutes bacterium]|nr:DegV family protein [Bacillota bacterium]
MYQLISDGGCDFSKEEAKKYNVDIVPFYVTFDEVNYLKEGVDITIAEYFKRLKENKNLFPKTAQPSPQDYIDIYTPHLEAGKDIISLTISSKLSGSYNSATLAANTLKDDFPNRSIIVIDSLNGAVGQGLIVKEMAKMRDNGYSITETARITREVIKTVKIYFTLDSLEYLKRGGRVGPTTALVGGILGLRPVLHLVDGAVEQLDSVRGKKKVLQLIEEGLVDALKNETENINISVGHILSHEDAAKIKDNLEVSLDTKITNPVTEVGVTIGTHAGPGALAIAYCRKYESIVTAAYSVA